MYCPNCKQEFDGKFCPECGAKLIEKTQRICPNCNIEVESKFCPECGTKTVEVAEKMVKMCPNCKIETESKFCPECGTKIVEMAVKATVTGEVVATGQQEDAETCYRTAQDYYYGNNGKQKDDEAAAQWYLKAAEQGHLESLYCLGCMLKEVCEFEDAFGCFQQAAEQGHAAAQYELGAAYSMGFGTEQDDDESMKWYRKAAEQGHQEAIDFLEELGERVPAVGNDIVTYYNTAMEYHLGINGKKTDGKKAFEWYQRAAEMGLAEAQVQLAGCYRRGYGVESDIDLAFEWYHKAAEQGNGWAQYALGHLYNQPFKGHPRDEKEMQKWYKKAFAQGIRELPGLPKPLSPEAIAKATELQAAGTKVSVEKKSNKPTETKKKDTGKKEPKYCLRDLFNNLTVFDVCEDRKVWTFEEAYECFDEIYTHWECFCNCPQELQEKKMTKEEMSQLLNQRMGWDILLTVIKYAHYSEDGEDDWQIYEDDCIIEGIYKIQSRIDDEPWLEVSWGSQKKFIDILCNFQVTDREGEELIDTMQIDYQLMNSLVSVIENVASDSLPLHDRFSGSEAEDVFAWDNDANTMKELLKFACAVAAGEDPKINDDSLFEAPDSFNEGYNYEICFPDAREYICDWPGDFQDDEDN